MNHPYDSLRERLVLPFVMLGYGVSVILSLATFALVASLEERAILRMLQVELQSFNHRLAVKPEAAPVTSTLLQGYFLPDERLPGISAPPQGEYLEVRTLNGVEYSILATHVAGRPYALLYDRSYLSDSLGRLALALLAGVAGMCLLSYLIGLRLAGQVVRPIRRLVEDLSHKASSADPRRDPVAFPATDYPNNEVGHLVRLLDRFAARLSGFVQRESHFASDVSHELRTPVAVIRGTAEIVAARPDLPEAVRPRIATIHRQSVRMGEVLEAMLLLAREEEGRDPEDDPSCSLAEVIRDVVEDCQAMVAGRGGEISLALQARPRLPVERSMAYVVCSNLLRNACTHGGNGPIRVSLDEAGFEVCDSGGGIPEERYPTLFQRHARGEGSEGWGLGLSIVARVAQRLAWRVSIGPAETGGTRVRVDFPATQTAPPA